MKYLIILFVFLSCTRDQAANSVNQLTQNAYNAEITKHEVIVANSRTSFKIYINVKRADSATSLEIARADYAYIYNINGFKEGENSLYDYQINNNASQTSYVLISKMITGETRTSKVFILKH